MPKQLEQQIIDAARTWDEIQNELCSAAEKVVQGCQKHGHPIKRMWAQET